MKVTVDGGRNFIDKSFVDKVNKYPLNRFVEAVKSQVFDMFRLNERKIFDAFVSVSAEVMKSLAADVFGKFVRPCVEHAEKFNHGCRVDVGRTRIKKKVLDNFWEIVLETVNRRLSVVLTFVFDVKVNA